VGREQGSGFSKKEGQEVINGVGDTRTFLGNCGRWSGACRIHPHNRGRVDYEKGGKIAWLPREKRISIMGQKGGGEHRAGPR